MYVCKCRVDTFFHSFIPLLSKLIYTGIYVDCYDVFILIIYHTFWLCEAYSPTTATHRVQIHITCIHHIILICNDKLLELIWMGTGKMRTTNVQCSHRIAYAIATCGTNWMQIKWTRTQHTTHKHYHYNSDSTKIAKHSNCDLHWIWMHRGRVKYIALAQGHRRLRKLRNILIE